MFAEGIVAVWKQAPYKKSFIYQLGLDEKQIGLIEAANDEAKKAYDAYHKNYVKVNTGGLAQILVTEIRTNTKSSFLGFTPANYFVKLLVP